MKKIILCAFGTIAISLVINCDAMIQCPQEMLEVSHTTTTKTITEAHNSEIRKLQYKLDAYANTFKSGTASHDFIKKLHSTLFADYRQPAKMTKTRVNHGISDNELFQRLGLIVDQDDFLTKDVFLQFYTGQWEEAKQITPADQAFWFVSQETETSFEEIEKEFIQKIKKQKEERLEEQRLKEAQSQYTTEELKKLDVQRLSLMLNIASYMTKIRGGIDTYQRILNGIIKAHSTKKSDLCVITDDDLLRHFETLIPGTEIDAVKWKKPEGGIWLIAPELATELGFN